MDEKEIKGTKDQEKNISVKSVVLLIIRIILCIGLIGFSFGFIMDSLENHSVALVASSSSELIINAYNTTYEQYVGDNKSASDVRALDYRISTHNRNVEESSNYGQIKINLVTKGKSGELIEYNTNLENGNSIVSHIKDSKFYQIRVSHYLNFGTVSRVFIREQSTYDDIIDIDTTQYLDVYYPNFENNAIQENNAQDNTFKIYSMGEFTLGILIVLFFGITLINGLFSLIKRKYSRINVIIDLIQIVLLFIPMELFLIYVSLELFLKNIVLSSQFYLENFLEIFLYSMLFIVLAICLIVYLIRFIMVFKRSKSSKNYEKIVGTIIPFLLVMIIVIGSMILITYNSAVADKPIIYIYPEEETNLEVSLGYPQNITCSYPNYTKHNGWKVQASPNGDLIDLNTDKKLYSLYWEGKNPNLNMNMSKGFVVKGEDIADFLDEKLEILGLNYKEREEFIVYWLPQLEENKYNYIRFDLTDECNKYMPLEINKINDDGSKEKADIDTLIRILMVFKPLSHEINVEEQILPRQERTGFTVVEWGGSKM